MQHKTHRYKAKSINRAFGPSSYKTKSKTDMLQMIKLL